MPPGVAQTVPSEPLGLGRPWLLKTLNASTLTRRSTLSVIGKILDSEMSALQFIGPCNGSSMDGPERPLSFNHGDLTVITLPNSSHFECTLGLSVNVFAAAPTREVAVSG
jgi:hypothetical protein